MAPPNPSQATSDHVNYLIWRYLQENGFGEAAVKLEQKWNHDPRKLPFADNIEHKALQRLVQKGLEFHAIEKRSRNPALGEPATALAIYFGTPEGRRLSADLPIRGSVGPDAGPQRAPRKHGRTHTTNGLSLDLPAVKRSRRSGTETSLNGDAMPGEQNGYLDRPEHESDTNTYSPADQANSANGMDIDDEPGTPTPEPAFTLSIGESKAIQIDQPIDLADRTSIQSLPSTNQAIMHLAYNPQDPTVLAAGGEALARIWHTSRMAGSTDEAQDYHDILPPSEDSYVSAVAWSPNGEYLAIASRNASLSQLAGAVSLWTMQGKCIEELPATQEMVIKLRWNPSGTHLLGITSSGMSNTSLVIWQAGSSTQSLPCEVQTELRDVTWTNDGQFAVCGKNIIATSTDIATGAVALNASTDTDVLSRTWTHILQDSPREDKFIAADEHGCLAIISREGGIVSTREAHDGELTGFELRPSASLAAYQNDRMTLMATSGMEGDVKIWNARDLDQLHTFSFIGPVMSLSFTPDGHLLAAGSPTRIHVWNPKEVGPPKAIWKGEVGKAAQRKMVTNGNVNGNGHSEMALDRDSAIGDDADDEECSLSWDAEGKKLAMGVGSQFAVVNFGP